MVPHTVPQVRGGWRESVRRGGQHFGGGRARIRAALSRPPRLVLAGLLRQRASVVTSRPPCLATSPRFACCAPSGKAVIAARSPRPGQTRPPRRAKKVA